MINVHRLMLVKEKGQVPWDSRKTVTTPDAVAKMMTKYLSGADREHFVVVALDTRLHVIGVNTVSVGALDQSVVHPREVFKYAVLTNAASLILCHNHPSGDLEPSEEDIRTTRRLKQAGEILGIGVVDHIIVHQDRWLSMQKHGSLP
ncbi:MAG: JAB domain-containing protein [Dehalococcoidia bacterium]|nr:JAB domain-containing protein [Dehalococcoidia bacterium]